ncbi:MAG: ribosome biogenesis GTPase YqeH [Solobacterium sp.]|nr:ribosome biogenesis GTPase YqeH [Solobacterium sp.]
MSTCRGCGAILQTTNPNAAGYTPKEGSAYCKRCFRLIHYDDLTVSMKTGIDPDQVLDGIAQLNAAVLYVTDLFDFESGMIPGLSRKIGDRDIILACTKRDLLPETVSHDKIARFVFGRLKEYGIHVKALHLVSGTSKEGVDELREALHELAKERPIVVMGRANSGKSTLLNALANQAVLTSSRYPGTTLEFNELEIDGLKFVDTPGIEVQHSMIMKVAERELKTILPSSTIKPTVFQIHEDQSYAVGGLTRVDVRCEGKGTVTWYISDRLYLHRSKAETADDLWKKQYGKLLVPVPETNRTITRTYKRNEEKTDVVVDGLGWCCLSGDITTIRVTTPEDVNVTFRKAML